MSVTPLIAGGLAGICVDLTFFPIDTLKTRLQAKNGFFANGGWHGVYKGIGSTIVASAPGASLFFVTYENVKQQLLEANGSNILGHKFSEPGAHMIAASCGEVAACSVRVPSELIKQRVQTLQYSSSFNALKTIFKQHTFLNALKTLYTGFGITLMREIPFTAIQFPLYEKLKVVANTNKHPITGAVCGSIAGAVAAALTTPLDVIKTRLMTSSKNDSIIDVIQQVRGEGFKVFWRGIVPRTLWISAGGAVFLGVYEVAHTAMS